MLFLHLPVNIFSSNLTIVVSQLPRKYYLCYRYKNIHEMSLTYSDKVQIDRQREIDEYRESIVNILESSKQLAMDCDNLVKLRALKTRCEKISKPRVGPGYTEQQKVYQKRKYQDKKEKTCERLKEKRQHIRDLGGVDVGKFFNSVPV